MSSSIKIISLITVLFTTLCIGIVSARYSDQTLEQRTRMAAGPFLSQPTESAKRIINDYFTEVMHGKDEGTALLGFEIVDVNTANLQDIKVAVRLNYVNGLHLPTTNYSIILIKNHYQVKKQYCSYDGIPESPTYGSLIGCTYERSDNGISIQS
ncbi:hypothetical protein [Paenibacillus paridis]|uniref:hypothetical protein n=1 Tax=Paenibacillus paridis TaxID=2583376 RepID=UPI001124C966|nr:hypothetical protein [Paenibacillus paridis]